MSTRHAEDTTVVRVGFSPDTRVSECGQVVTLAELVEGIELVTCPLCIAVLGRRSVWALSAPFDDLTSTVKEMQRAARLVQGAAEALHEPVLAVVGALKRVRIPELVVRPTHIVDDSFAATGRSHTFCNLFVYADEDDFVRDASMFVGVSPQRAVFTSQIADDPVRATCRECLSSAAHRAAWLLTPESP